MARDPFEAQQLRDDTEQFIRDDLEMLTLVRVTKTPDGAGGWTEESPTPLAPQEMRFQPTVSRASSERTTQAGAIVVPDYEVIAKHDADIQRGDTFTLEGHEYEVVFVEDSSEYRTVAEVVRGGA